MTLRWLWLVTLALLLASPAAARTELSPGEREIVAWSRPANPALIFEVSLFNLLAAEDAARRALLLERCPIPLWAPPVRFVNPKYAAVMREATRIVDLLLAQADELPNEWSVGATAAWRSWRASQRRSWLTYMRSAEARRGSEWDWTMAAFEAFHESAIHWDTGRPNLLWPAWTAEFLAKAGLSSRFREAANSLEAGLGDRFATEAARPVVYPVDDVQQQAISAVIERLKQHWPAIRRTLSVGTDPATADAVRSWSNHPLVREIEAHSLETRIERPTEVSLSTVARFSRRNDHLLIIDRPLVQTLRTRAGTMCSALQ